MSDDLLNLSCSELAQKISTGKVKSTDACKAVFSAIEKYENGELKVADSADVEGHWM